MLPLLALSLSIDCDSLLDGPGPKNNEAARQGALPKARRREASWVGEAGASCQWKYISPRAARLYKHLMIWAARIS